MALKTRSRADSHLSTSSQDTSVFHNWQIGWVDSTRTSPCSGSLNPRRDKVSLNISDSNKPVTKSSNIQAVILGPSVLSGAFPVWDSSDQMLASVLQILRSVCLYHQQRETSTREAQLMLKPMSGTGEEDNPQQFFVLFVGYAGRQQGPALTEREKCFVNIYSQVG